MYKASPLFERSAAERKDPFLFRQRADQPFFANGACHVLVEMFRRLHYDEGYVLILGRPASGAFGTHVYACNGEWAFDHNGWFSEIALLIAVKRAYTAHDAAWDFERVVVNDDIESFCRRHTHQLPWDFAYLPWERAYNYIKRFPEAPPEP